MESSNSRAEELTETLFQKLKSKKRENKQTADNVLKQKTYIQPDSDNKPSNLKVKYTKGNKNGLKLSLDDILESYKNEPDAMAIKENSKKLNRASIISADTEQDDMEISNDVSHFGFDHTMESPKNVLKTNLLPVNLNEPVEYGLLLNTSLTRDQHFFELVLDTNFIISNLPLIKVMVQIQYKMLSIGRKFFKICIFDIVLSELDKLKQNHRRENNALLDLNSNKSEDASVKFKAIKANNFIYQQVMETVNQENNISYDVLHLSTKKDLINYEKKHKLNAYYEQFSSDEFITNNNDDKILQSTVRLQKIIENQSELAFDYKFIHNDNKVQSEKFKILPPPLLVVLSNDKNFCLKLFSHSIKTISLQSETDNSEDELLKNAKMILLKCLNVQIKILLENWQNMVTINVFETLIKNKNCSNLMLSILEDICYQRQLGKDNKYWLHILELFAVNNFENDTIDELLDKTPDMMFLFTNLVKTTTIFQQILVEALQVLDIHGINENYCFNVVERIFFCGIDIEIETVLNKAINVITNSTDDVTEENNLNILIQELRVYIDSLNHVARIWEAILFTMSQGIDPTHAVQNFKTKLQFIWNDIVVILADVVKISTIKLKDLDN
ncbi:hypothetical protein QEN19_000311 [Hanseniaspora menglaensis]